MKSVLTDILAVLGASSLITGVAMVYVPAAYMVGGLLLLTISVLGAKRWAS